MINNSYRRHVNRHRDDGVATAELLIPAVMLVATAIVVMILLSNAGHHRQHPQLPALGVGAAAAAGVVLIAMVLYLVQPVLHELVVKYTRWRWSERLREWNQLAPGDDLATEHVEDWVRYRRRPLWRPLTARVAEQWAAEGMSPPIAAAGHAKHVDPAAAHTLARVMQDTGAWDGRDQLALSRIIGWHWSQ